MCLSARGAAAPRDKEQHYASPKCRSESTPLRGAISAPRRRPAIAIDPVAPRCSRASLPTGFANAEHFQMWIQRNRDFRIASRAREVEQIGATRSTFKSISLPRLRPAVGDHPVARPAASTAGELSKKKIRRGARRRQRRQRIKTATVQQRLRKRQLQQLPNDGRFAGRRPRPGSQHTEHSDERHSACHPGSIVFRHH